MSLDQSDNLSVHCVFSERDTSKKGYQTSCQLLLIMRYEVVSLSRGSSPSECLPFGVYFERLSTLNLLSLILKYRMLGLGYSRQKIMYEDFLSFIYASGYTLML